MSTGKKPFLCKLGFHRPYIDSAFLNHVERCNEPECNWVSSKADEARLNAERKAWSQVRAEGGEGFGSQVLRVMEIMNSEAEALDK